jgi:rhodanese-related sulfurtransferase
MRIFTLLVFAMLTGLAACGRSDQKTPPAVSAAQSADALAEERTISGRLEEGLRVLTFDPALPGMRYVIYRGDYVRPELVNGEPFTIEIPALDVTMSVPVPEGERTYFKVPEAGIFPFRIGNLTGEIEAIEYADSRYREVTAQEAARYIADVHPLVLDVRTPREFASGHLENAVLIPIQNLARRIGELEAHKDQPVFVYCRTGNRSTVAAQMLIKAGFTEIVNLRRGIVEWTREGLPVVK